MRHSLIMRTALLGVDRTLFGRHFFSEKNKGRRIFSKQKGAIIFLDKFFPEPPLVPGLFLTGPF